MADEKKTVEKKVEPTVFTQREVALIGNSINISKIKDGQPQARVFPTAKLHTASEIYQEFDGIVHEDGSIPEGEHALTLGTKAKKLIIDCIEDREWMAIDATRVLSLKDKLS
ncbi:MAG TPA: hypothetical protein DHN29_01655 [Cytophagales bacterium]|jgi:hypothetical protein|nr:hypothetical protein [Cytophagales bacterium]|tara:strand:+ start:977 stop:1312 length:336 start_codon:yes stop_codon:yes gene_type:complete